MKPFQQITALVLTALSISACATTYGDMGFTGGVTSAAVTNDTVRISARGNGFTDATTVQDYSLLKAAEVTLAAGYTHFTVLSGSNASRNATVTTPGTFNTNFYGNAAFTTYNPGSSYDIVKPGEDLMIRMFTPKGGGMMPPNSFPAQEVFTNISPRVKRPK